MTYMEYKCIIIRDLLIGYTFNFQFLMQREYHTLSGSGLLQLAFCQERLNKTLNKETISIFNSKTGTVVEFSEPNATELTIALSR